MYYADLLRCLGLSDVPLLEELIIDAVYAVSHAFIAQSHLLRTTDDLCLPQGLLKGKLSQRDSTFIVTEFAVRDVKISEISLLLNKLAALYLYFFCV